MAWDFYTWLLNNYDSDNVALDFFTAGQYAPEQKQIAENEFRAAVEELSLCEENNVKEWARDLIDSGFRILQSNETSSFWLSNAIVANIRKDMTNIETLKFVHCTSKDFDKRKIELTKIPSSKRTSVHEEDNVFVDGLHSSLFSLLKTKAVNDSYRFADMDYQQQYFHTISMNNVMDMTDTTDSSQLALFNQQQRHQLEALFNSDFNYANEGLYKDTIKEIIAKYENNLCHALTKLNSLLSNAPTGSDDISIIKMYRHIMEAHVHTPTDFNEDAQSKYSEFDFILYFWGPLIKNLFTGTQIWSHWGDTESKNCNQKFRMDLRLLCRSLVDSHDLAGGEFGRTVSSRKYYDDKKKLVLNGLVQLKNIIKDYPGVPKDIKLPLFQALGFEGDLYYIYQFKEKCYVINKISTLSFPRTKKHLITRTISLVEKLLILKNLSCELEDNVMEAASSRKKSIDDIFSPSSSTKIDLPETVWMSP